jgi:hypothetical protein
MPDDPDQLVLLTSARTEFEGRAMAAVIEGQGIPVEVFATAAQMVQWDGGPSNTVRVMVRRRDVQAAALALQRAHRDSVDIDWDEVDVGSPEDPGTPRRPRGRIGGLSPWLWRIRVIGWGLLSAVFLVWAIGFQFALPVAVFAGVMILMSLADRGGRGASSESARDTRR